MLEVVSIGAVKIGDELIVLKQRPMYDLVEENMITYNEVHDMNYHYQELIAKSVIFDQKLLNLRGRQAIEEYIIEEEFKYCQECGKPLDRESDEYHRSFGTCDQYCYGRMVGVYL
jgi:NADH pyrophosphatase NudC (nudix superfamily)